MKIKLKHSKYIHGQYGHVEFQNFLGPMIKKESCFILEGEILIITDYQTVNIRKKDFVIFPKGLSCNWNVSKPVKKHYMFE